MTTHEMITIVHELVGISMETIDCMTSIDGYNKETCENILYWKTGYEDFDEYMKEWEEETYYYNP